MLSSFTGVSKFGRRRKLASAVLVLELDAFGYSGSGAWQDGTANNNDAALQGTPTHFDAVGLSDYFDLVPADGDYFSIADAAVLDSMTEISVLMWMQVDTISAAGPNMLFSKRDSTSNGYVGFFTTTGWTFRFGTGTGTGLTYSTPPATNVWQQVVVTIGATGSKLYINDAEVASSGYTGNGANVNTSAALDLFEVNPRPQSGPVKMDGKVGVFKIYNGILTLAQVQEQFSIYENRYTIVPAGLTMLLTATTYSGSGTTWDDQASGGASDVTLVNSPVRTAGSPAYFTFNSASSQSATGTTENVVPSFQYTKGVWFYLNSYADNNLVSSESGGHYMFMGGESRIYAGNSHITPYVGGFGSLSTISLNTWYYAVVTYHFANGIKIYINGQLDASDATYNNSTQSANHTGDGTTNIGRYGAGNFLNGRIGEVHCYGRALDANEVLQNYYATKGTYGL